MNSDTSIQWNTLLKKKGDYKIKKKKRKKIIYKFFSLTGKAAVGAGKPFL